MSGGIQGHAYQGRRFFRSRCTVCGQRRSYCAHSDPRRSCPCMPYGCWQRAVPSEGKTT